MKLRTPGLLRVLVALAALSAPASAQVVFSEYVEGSGFNRAVEVHNFSRASVDLSRYWIDVHLDGSAVPSEHIVLGPGTLAAGEVWVVAHPGIDPDVLSRVDQLADTLLFDGNDALVLASPGGVRDAIGEVGMDPGTHWGTGATVTRDATLRRTGYDCTTPYVGEGAYDPAVGWAGHTGDDLGGLGASPSGLQLTNCTFASATYRNPSFWGSVNPAAYLVSSPPVLGSTYVASINTSGKGGAYLVGFLGERLEPTRWGNILVDYTNPTGEVLGAIWGLGNPVVIEVDIPPSYTLAGATICTQAVRFGGGVDLTNAQDLRFGY
jgi:hypothetical protein